MVFYLASRKDAALIEIDTKNELKKVNHKGHKEHIGREARKIKFLRPLRDLRSFAGVHPERSRRAQDTPL
jgi:hypothetical protein